MASPQVENGHTRISNELLERLISCRFTSNQFKVILAIVRKTYGYSKKMDSLSLGQLGEMTGIQSSANVAATLRQLVRMNVIVKERTRYVSRYGIQKDYEQWNLSGRNTVQANSVCINSVYSHRENTVCTNRYKRNKKKKERTGEKSPSLLQDEIQKLKDRYPAAAVDRALDGIACTRKAGKVADSVINSFLTKLNKFDTQHAIAALQTYNEKYHGKKDEKYLLGIARRIHRNGGEDPSHKDFNLSPDESWAHLGIL